MDAIHSLELAITLWLQGLGDFLAPIMQGVSFLGSEQFYLAAMPLLYWSVDSAIGLRFAWMLLLSNASNAFFKYLFHSPRPYWVSSEVKAYAAESSFGLPSGHSQNSASLWGLAAVTLRSPWLRAGALAIVFLVGLSRIYLGVHFTTDVLLGWTLGFLLLWAFVKLEPAVTRWLKGQSFRGWVVATLVSTALILFIPFTAGALDTRPILPEWQANALAATPDDPINPLELHGNFTIAGTWLGMNLGLALFRKNWQAFDASGSLQLRALRYLVGIIGVLILYVGLGQLFPRTEDWLGYGLRFLRYILIGLWVGWGAPLFFIRFKLAKPSLPAQG